MSESKMTKTELSEYGERFMRGHISKRNHDWDAGKDGWGIVFGVSRCKICDEVATQKKLSANCEGKKL